MIREPQQADKTENENFFFSIQLGHSPYWRGTEQLKVQFAYFPNKALYKHACNQKLNTKYKKYKVTT